MFQIEPLSPNDYRATAMAIGPFRPMQYHLWPGATAERAAEQTLARFAAYKGRVLVARTASLPIALLGWIDLAWDTDFFGFRCRRIDFAHIDRRVDSAQVKAALGALLAEYLRSAASDAVAFTSFDVDADDAIVNDVLRASNFDFILTWIDGFKRADPTARAPSLPPIPSSEVERFAQIASRDYFKGGRFYIDRRFDRSKVDDLYRSLVRNSYSAGETFVVHRVDGEATGLFICRKIEVYERFDGLRVAPLRFLLIDPAARGKSLGKAIFQETLDELGSTSDIITTGLEISNLVSLNLHARLGFTFNYLHNVYHHWAR